MPKSHEMRWLYFAVALASSGVFGSSADAAPGDIYNLGTLGGRESHGYSINDTGQVAGYSHVTTDDGQVIHSFRYTGTPGSGGVMQDLGTGYAFGINSSGRVAGYANTLSGDDHAFRYTGTPGAGGAKQDLGTLGGQFSAAYAINDAGQVTGQADTAFNGGNGARHAFRYTGTPGSGGAMADLGTLNGGGYSFGYAINNAGQVTGYSETPGITFGNHNPHAFRYTGTPGAGGAMADLGTLGGPFSYGYGINDAGQVVGEAYTPTLDLHAFRYTGTPGSGGAMVDLGTLGGSISHASGINDAGFVVGRADRFNDGTIGGAWPTLWRADAANTPVDLDAWLDAVNPALGAYWRLGDARDINNNGLITGSGLYDDGPGGLTDEIRAFILDASSIVDPLLGDTDFDSDRDLADLGNLAGSYGVTSGAGWMNGDFDGDGDVDLNDLGTLATHYGSGETQAFVDFRSVTTTAIPEPAAVPLALLPAIGLTARRRRHRGAVSGR
jgi:probable HAF family extracellular repeat protein